ncbi:Probable FAD synthase [Seminavis robusta]|uniref:FAD synthase n=1 Tax=Seminavis robusta TaxID=568900 RepID=A0A9N8DIG5_9STRA|nr:Probable FAD synthase [Seminavis robusta]|eukprot:Sro103_g052450.1 Probable FAD synthase (696) ;mRNA; r:41868-44063
MGIQSTQDPTTSSTSTSSETTIPNWRVLSLPKEEDQEDSLAFLQERAPWSNQQYQEALDLYDKFISCSDSYIAPGIKDALNVLDHAYRLYGPQSVVCSFNGGKDAVVILQLLRAAHAHHYRQQEEQQQEHDKTTIIRPRALYFEHADEFPQVLAYLQNSVQQYDLDMIAFDKGIKFNQGLEVLVQNNLVPQQSSSTKITLPMGFVLGTRVGDPNAGDQGYFCPSSHYMPPFMRVNPILEWTYGQVWHFLRVFSLPYCVLYDQGYTSLGTTKDTNPCPALAVPGMTVTQNTTLPKYWPAYMLQDWSQERAGRIKKEKKKSSTTTATTKDNNKGDNIPSTSSAPSNKAESVISIPSALRATDPKQLIRKKQDELAISPVETQNDGGENADNDLDESCWSYDKSSNHSLASSVEQRTAGLLVIGDEILKGATADTNTQAAAKAFRENSVLLKRVVVVSDDQEAIINEILQMQNEVDILVTSGGVGPTHDDVTIKSVAAALNQDLVLHEEMALLLQEKMNKTDNDSNSNDNNAVVELTEAQRKMATLPSRSKLRYLADKQDWPVLQCRNIFILPGVPEFFTHKIEYVADYVSSDIELERSTVYKVILSVDETSIVTVLNTAVEAHPDVTFGSYPFVSHPEFKTVLTLEGRLRSAEPEIFSRKSFSKPQMDHHVRMALDYLLTHLPEGSILRVENDDGLL